MVHSSSTWVSNHVSSLGCGISQSMGASIFFHTDMTSERLVMFASLYTGTLQTAMDTWSSAHLAALAIAQTIWCWFGVQINTNIPLSSTIWWVMLATLWNSRISIWFHTGTPHDGIPYIAWFVGKKINAAETDAFTHWSSLSVMRDTRWQCLSTKERMFSVMILLSKLMSKCPILMLPPSNPAKYTQLYLH